MKFITEIDLRNLFRERAFVTFTLDSEQRLTPEARQFLIDRGIKIIQPDCEKKYQEHKEYVESKNSGFENSNLKTLKLYSKMEYVSSLFLLTGEQLINRNVILAQKLFILTKLFRELQNGQNLQLIETDLKCEVCAGINNNNFSDNLGNCFEITEFHIQLAKGGEIAALNHLRSALKEVEPALLEAYEEKQLSDSLCTIIISRVNQIINTLNHLICLCVGGEKCQR